ncbi:hypothetical protein [Mameliella alba]|uniref:hypothetical protein n=1 Tax=Mameliella alba TaxID=561184 RepID=UPI000B52CB19|nr:hypothetical protein [Mameliella alba]OWV40379.1 hypothetical protein CDZ95_21365 [Mameliella alba]
MSYGYQINRADGTEQVGSDNTVFRHLVTETFTFDADETRYVDDIPSDLFTVQITPHAAAKHIFEGRYAYMVNYFDVPSITVSEVSDTITVTPPISEVGHVQGDYSVIVLEYG